jgi:hypothetical protein
MLKFVVHCAIKYYFSWVSILFFGLGSAFGQMTTPVTKIIATTADSIDFRISVAKAAFRRGDNITIDYAVTNMGNKPVYLVTEPSTNVKVESISILRLVQPVIGADDHLPYDYYLVRINPTRTYRGSLSLNSKYYLSDENYDFSTAQIQVGFSYLFDKSKLFGCDKTAHVLPCLLELSNKSKNLTIGNLMVEIIEKNNR